ncbi:MAG: hypothetical protein AAFY71_09330 [Bacteroidota bacterium]
MNTSTLWLFCCLVLSTTLLSAQDILILQNKEKLDVKILEIGSTDIRYKLLDELEGPILKVPKEEVLMVMYEDGSKKSFENYSSSSKGKEGDYFDDLEIKALTHKLGPRDLENMQKNNPRIYRDYLQARRGKNILNVAGIIASAATLGIMIDELSTFDTNNFSSLNLGPGFVLAGGITIASGFAEHRYKKKMEEAIDFHNAEVRSNRYGYIELHLQLSPQALGIVISF